MRKNYKKGASGYFGVYWHKKAKKWNVRIRDGKGFFHIGLFSDIIEAAKAYDLEIVKRRGYSEDICINFPPESGRQTKTKEFKDMTYNELFK